MAEAALSYDSLFGETSSPKAGDVAAPVVKENTKDTYDDVFGTTDASNKSDYADLFGTDKAPEEPSFSEEVSYGFKGDHINSWQKLGDWLDTYYPGTSLEFVRPSKALKLMAGSMAKDPKIIQSALDDYANIFDNAKRKYGEDYNTLTPDERLVRQKEYKNAQLQEMYPNIHGTENADSFGVGVGQALSVLDDPLAAVSLGATYIQSALRTGGLLMFDKTANDLGNTGKVDVYGTSIAGGAGLILGPSLLFAGKYVSKKYGEYITNKLDEMAEEPVKLMNKTIDDVNEFIIEARATGRDELDSLLYALEKTGVKHDDLFGALLETDRRLIIPKTAEMAEDMFLGGSVRTSRMGGKVSQWVDDFIEPVQAGIKRISGAVHGRLMKYEANIRIKLHDAIAEVGPLREYIRTLPKESQARFNRLWQDQDIDSMKLFLRQSPEALQAFEKIRPRMDALYKELKEVGYKDLEYIANYLPRQLLDYETLVKKLPARLQDRISGAVSAKASKLGRKLTDLEEADTINKALRGIRPSKEGPISASKERKFLEKIPEEWRDHYASWDTAYTLYLKKAIGDAEKRTLFGRHIQINKDTNTVDMDKSIGAVIAADKELMLNPEAKTRLVELLQARFIAGEAPTNKIVQSLKNFIYTTTLGNIRNTLEQVKDISQSFYKQGLFNTVKALSQDKFVRAVDIGVSDIANELEQSAIRSARNMERALRYNGFSTVDKFGKTVHINAAMHRILSAIASPESKGYNAFVAKYTDMFPGEELVKLMDDLKAGNVSHDVKTLLFTELSQVQPISKSVTPVKYLQNPNGRLFYSLKTFQLTQFNVVREDIFRQYAKGNYMEATKNLVRFGAYTSLLGVPVEMVKAMLAGHEVSVDDIPDIVLNNSLKVLGTSEYALAKSASGKISNLVSSQLEIPIWSVVNAVTSDTIALHEEFFGDSFTMKDGKFQDKPGHDYKSLKYVPLVGDFMYKYLGGGMEKAAYEDKKKKEKKINDMFKGH